MDENYPIQHEDHVWTPFILDKDKEGLLGYHRICMICGVLDYRDKLKEWFQNGISRS